jgi:hypothetical protein
MLGDRTRDSAGQDTVGQDVGDQAVGAERDSPPGQRQSGTDHMVVDADVPERAHGPLDLDDATGWRGQ